MSAQELDYQGLADMTLFYGDCPGLGRQAERPGVELMLDRDPRAGSVMVSVPKALHLDLFKGPCRARLVLPDGRVFAGAVRSPELFEDRFELVEDGQP